MQDMMQDSHSSRADACAARKTNDCRCERWPGMQDQRFLILLRTLESEPGLKHMDQSKKKKYFGQVARTDVLKKRTPAETLVPRSYHVKSLV